ncbi:ubinuclein-1 isoform X4 [Morus notabilis]|uniref:ubinuclein-1 isoform X4 n=1 Tax=Morus notabilis TaxID=981085 RepID=UPI000CED559E|nr:ubinuclein-1 isoform X4 [Morus notabilis]
MEEEKRRGGDSSRASSSFVKSGDRQMFTVELRPGETTIVSWKKLMKDANKVDGGSASAPEPPANAHPRLESRIAPVQQPANEEVKEDPAPHRFSAVIEKIERLYMGKDSSDDEDMNEIPDDDQYDTEDSFIDDAELDEYFEVDNSAIKHDGFFVNRGKLERFETTVLPNQQPKKRRRKDLAKGNGENNDDRLPNKHTKLEVKDIDKQKASKDPSSKFKDVAVSSDALHQKYHDKSAYAQSRPQSGKLLGSVDELDSSVRLKEKNGIREQPDVNAFEGKYSTTSTKTSHMHKKDGSSIRPKSSMLEKAIRELEKMVAESRPPAVESQEVDNSSQTIKRRLPREIKMKLAKVARLAQASHGKVSKELLARLMSILGHLIQLRTLKRNLKIMINTGLSAKQEKDDRFQQIKKEVIDMIKTRAPSMELKALELQAGASDNFQEIATGEKEASKRKFSMDAALEDKICDLYDLYVDGLDEDAGPQIRKLYAELAELWPNGFMDNHGIKRAICRTKERRRALYSRNKEQEKIKRKKMLALRLEEGIRVEASSMMQAQYMRERLVTESSSHGTANKPVSATTAAARMPSPLNVPSFDKPKQEKLKGSSSNSLDDARVGDGTLTKKKVKRKPETESDETRFRPEKLTSQQGEERQKPLKQAASLPHKPNLQSTVLPSVEQSS